MELVPATRSRENSSVGVWLQVEDGSRLSGEFPSSRKLYFKNVILFIKIFKFVLNNYFLLENLWEIIQILLKDKLSNYESPAIIYTRMEIIGKEQLQQKTLKDIGLVSGKALLRLVKN